MQVMLHYTLSLFVLPLTCWLMSLVTRSVFIAFLHDHQMDTHVCVVMPTRMYSLGLNLRSVKEPFFLSDPFILGWPLVQFPISTSNSSLFHSGRLVTASASFPPLYKIQSCKKKLEICVSQMWRDDIEVSPQLWHPNEFDCYTTWLPHNRECTTQNGVILVTSILITLWELFSGFLATSG